MTGEAALVSRLHLFLREYGLGLGLLERLKLDPQATTPREYSRLRHQLSRLDTSGGFRPDGDEQWALGWLVAGSVLQQLDGSTDRHHFYDPTNKRGLNDRHAPIGSVLGLLATIEGTDTLRKLMTGSAFSLAGESALDWLHAPSNPHRLERFMQLLRQSLAAEHPRTRHHALAHALIALGGLLHVLQDMAVPAHTRNDYVIAQLHRLGGSHFDRGSLYQRFVNLAYGRTGLPRFHDSPPTRQRIADYFANKQWTGLANYSHLHSFSAGTLPAAQAVTKTTKARELANRINSRLRYAEPTVSSLDLRCARQGGTCYVRRSDKSAVAAYRLGKDSRLTFRLDHSCMAATARALVPQAIGFSAGLIDHILRGSLVAERSGQQLTVSNRGPALTDHTVSVFVENKLGLRRRVAHQRDAALAADQITLIALPALSEETVRLVVILQGTDAHGDPLLSQSSIALAPPG